MEIERNIIIEKNKIQNNRPINNLEKQGIKAFKIWPHALKWGAGAGLSWVYIYCCSTPLVGEI